jgi:neopullulanase
MREVRLRLSMPRFTLISAGLAIFTLAAACSSEDSAERRAAPPGPDSGSAAPDSGSEGGPGPEETDIVFGEGATFAARSCTLTLRHAAGPGSVKIAGEFTGWETGAIAMTNSGSSFEVTLAPGPELEAGKLYAYKLIADGTWKLDPEGKYRKIVDGQMNSALKLPSCAAGPEVVSSALSAQPSGEMKVRVDIRSAQDGEAPSRVKASLDRAGVPAGSWKVDDAAGAIDFAVTGLAKGKHTLSLRAVDGKGRESEPVDLPFWIEDEPFDYRDGALYMFMVDRFANGSPANDKPLGVPVHYDADWHGGDLEGAKKVLESGYFEKLGVRTIWLSPLNRQTNNWHTGDGDQIYSAYHGYWPVKAREVEPRFGGDAALRAFVAEAHKRGIRVLLDLINNQVHKDHEYVQASSSWFRTACQCGAPGCGWSEKPFECLFQPYLPDIDWNQPGAEKQFIDDALYWIADFDLDGFRVDAVKHVEANSVYNMRAELTRRFEQGGARVFMAGETAVGEFDSGTFFGESFSDGFAWIDAYTGPTALDGQFDFPTRHNMADGLVSGDKPLSEVEAAIAKAEERYKPSAQHVRFLNGHDNPRIASIAAKDPKLGCSWASGCRDDELPPFTYTEPVVFQRLKRALTVLYTLPGIPYLYMGDEVAFGGGGDPDMRRDMVFAESELAPLVMSKPGVPAKTLSAQQLDLRDWVRKLGAARTASRALRRGKRVTLLGNEADFWVYAYEAAPKEIAIIALNRGSDPVVARSVALGSLQAAGVGSWKSALGTGTATPAGASLQISLGGGEAAIFVAQ